MPKGAGCGPGWYNNTNYSDPVQVTYTIQAGGKTVASGMDTAPAPSVGGYSVKTLTFADPVPVCLGMACQVRLQTSSKFFAVAYGEDGNSLGGSFHFSPVAARSGRVASVSYHIPASNGSRIWVRYRGGTVVPALLQNGTRRPLEQIDLRQTVNLQGQSCREAEFLSRQPLEAGTYAVELQLDTGADDAVTLYDYGVMLL